MGANDRADGGTGMPIELLEPEIMRFKVFEPIYLLGRERFKDVDIRCRVHGGGHVSQVYGTCPLPFERAH